MADDDAAVSTDELQPETEESEQQQERPVFQPDTQAAAPSAELARPVFQPTATATRPIFQPDKAAARPIFQAAEPTLAEKVAQETAEDYRPVPRAYTPAYLAAADQATAFKNQGDKDTLQSLFPKSGNLIQYHDLLDQPVPGVNPDTQAQFQTNLRNQITDLAKEQYGVSNPDQAWALASSDPNFGDYAHEAGKQFVGSFQKLLAGMQSGVNTDQLLLDRAVGSMSDDPETQANLKAQLLKGDQAQRGQILHTFLPYTSGIDTSALMFGLERLSDPDYQAGVKENVANVKTAAAKNLATDLKLEGSAAAKIVDTLSSAPANILAYTYFPPAAFKQTYDDTREQLARDNPGLSDTELDNRAISSTIVSFAGQEVGNRLLVGGAGKVIGGIQGRVQRAVAQAALQTVGQPTIMGGAQAGANIASGQPVFQGVPEAATSGLILGGAAGAVHGVGELAAPRTTGPTGARIRGPSERTLETTAEEAAQQPPPVQPAEAAPVTEAARPVTEAAPVTEVARPVTEAPPAPVDETTRVPPIREPVDQSPAQPVHPLETLRAEDVLTTPEEHIAALTEPGKLSETQKAGLPEAEFDVPTPEINYTPSKNIRPDMADFAKTSSLKEAATLAADRVSDPTIKAVAQQVASMVPKEANIGIADFTRPVTANGKEYSGALSAGLYHPDSATALISDSTTNPVGAVLHEATHAALNNAIKNPDSLSAEGQAAIAQINDAYRQALGAAPTRQPVWMSYGLSSPEEFLSAAVSDPRFQGWLGAVSSEGRPNIAGRIRTSAARLLGLPTDVPGSLAERTLGAIAQVGATPTETRNQAPIYAANPFAAIRTRALPSWLTGAERLARAATMTMRANLDAVPETRGLSRAMDQAYDTKDALLGQRTQATKEILALAKGHSQEIAAEFQRMAEQVDNGQAPATTNPRVQQVWDRMVRFKREDAQFMRDNEFQVQKPDGTWRPFIGLADPNMYVARTMREDVVEALRSPRDPNGAYTPEFTKIFNEGLAKGFFQKPEDLEAFIPVVGQGLTQGPRATSLETARMVRVPTFFYDYSIDGQLRNIYSSADTRARLSAFGQSRPGVPDLFQKTIEQINASPTLSFRDKQFATQNVKLARDEWYHQNTKGLYNTIGAGLRSGVSAIQTGNYYTSLKVGVARMFFSMQNNGVTNTMSGLIRTLADYGKTKAEARELGLIKDAISYQHEDLFNAPNLYRKFMNISRGVIELAGHGEVNRFANTVDMKASQLWLASALREIDRNPGSIASRMAREIIERRGVDLGALQGGDMGETRRFLRQWVNDVQTSYRIMDLPVWSKTPMGKLYFMYQPWAYNATRMLFKETVNPALAAFGRGDIQLGARYAARLLYFGAAAAGAEETMKAMREWIFGRETTAPSWPQFFNALYTHRGGLAFKLIMQRATDELVGGTFLGMMGDYARGVLNYASGHQEVANFWNPNSPPALSIVQSVFGLFNKWNAQGHKLSDKDISNFLGQMFSGFREVKNVTYSAAIGLKQATGVQVPIPGLSEAMGHREQLFAEAKFRQFTNEYPDFRGARMTATPSPASVYYSNLEDALYAGDIARARAIKREMQHDPTLKSEHLDAALISSMSHRQPIPGGNAGAAFLRWSRDVLPPEDLDRIRTIQEAFIKNAIRAGIFKDDATTTHALGYARKPSAKVRLVNP
jgi:hypothetical protein